MQQSLVGVDDANGKIDEVDLSLVAVEFDGELGVVGDEVVGIWEARGDITAAAAAAAVSILVSAIVFSFPILLLLFRKNVSQMTYFQA